MKNLNLTKVANIISVLVVFMLLITPLFVSAGNNTGFVIPSAPSGSNVPNDANISEIIIRVINILLAIAGLVAVVFLIIGGFRYITAGGNEESAEGAKKTITNAIIGVVIVILSFVIVRVISNALINNTQ